ALYNPLGSIACWMSRAISRSFFSDSRSATSSRTRRFIRASAKRSDQVPWLKSGPGTPMPPRNGTRAMSTIPMPRNRLMRPMIASRSDAPNTMRRAGDSFIEKAKNRIRASVACQSQYGSVVAKCRAKHIARTTLQQDAEFPADPGEHVQRELQLVAGVRGGDDRAHSRLVAGDGRKRDALREHAFLEQA